MAKLVLASGLEILQLGIGQRQYRSHWLVNNDCVHVDSRLLARKRRALIRRARRDGYIVESNPRRLDRILLRDPRSIV